MRLTSDVVMVGGGSLTGFGLSSDFDAHVYLLDGGTDHALVDCGMGTERGMELVLDRIGAAGIDPSAIGTLFLTHFHTDHAGGAARYRERLGLEVAIGREAQAALEIGRSHRDAVLRGQSGRHVSARLRLSAVPGRLIRSTTGTRALWPG